MKVKKNLRSAIVDTEKSLADAGSLSATTTARKRDLKDYMKQNLKNIETATDSSERYENLILKGKYANKAERRVFKSRIYAHIR